MNAPPRQISGRVVVASVSGGKDSAALALRMAEMGIDHRRVFMDTGWEHPATYHYVLDNRDDLVETVARVERVTEEVAESIVRSLESEHGQCGALPRVIGKIERIHGPRDMSALVLFKGMLPSRQRRYCTEELKVIPMQTLLTTLILDGEDPLNAVGIRNAESLERSTMPEWDEMQWRAEVDGNKVVRIIKVRKGRQSKSGEPFDCTVWRPLIAWSQEDVIDIHKRHNLRPNPLYLMGASRVGCWPCIYANKIEIRLIADKDPHRIDLLRQLEHDVAEKASARYAEKGETFESLGYVRPAFFQNPLPETRQEPCDCTDDDDEKVPPEPTCNRCKGTGIKTVRSGAPFPIDEMVKWSRTSHGGRQYDVFTPDPAAAGCMRWGMCETHGDDDA